MAPRADAGRRPSIRRGMVRALPNAPCTRVIFQAGALRTWVVASIKARSEWSECTCGFELAVGLLAPARPPRRYLAPLQLRAARESERREACRRLQENRLTLGLGFRGFAYRHKDRRCRCGDAGGHRCRFRP